MWSFALLGGCVVAVALLAIYVPTIYIRKTNKVLRILEQIAANTQDLRGDTSRPREVRTA